MNVQNKGLKPPGAMRDQISLGSDADLPVEEFFEDALEPYETDQSGPAAPINIASIPSANQPPNSGRP